MRRRSRINVIWLLFFLVPIQTVCAQAQVRLQNGYLRLVLDDGRPVSVEFAPEGKGAYRAGRASLSPFTVLDAGAASAEGLKIRVQGARYLDPKAGAGGYAGPFDSGDDLPPQGSLGQSFAIPPDGGRLTGVWALLTNGRAQNSAVTITLRRDGPAGGIIASRRVQPVPENERVPLLLGNPQPPGTFYLEISEKQGGAFWWGCRSDVYPGGTAFVSGKPLPERDRCFGYTVADTGTLDWEAELAGSAIRTRFTVREQALKGHTPALALSFPWRRDGFDTKDPAHTPFRYLWTDTGWYLPVEAFKRLESDWALEPKCVWALLRGTNGFDLRITHGRGKFAARMDADAMHILLGPEARIEALSESDALPDYLPRFFSSDPRTDDVLNRFFLTFFTSHTSTACTLGFDAAKLAWTSGPFHDSLKRVLIHFSRRTDPDGYVWSRGESRGWNGTDCSTHDTRLYDTNASFILACWRMYCWTGDREFLGAVGDSVRRATDYLLGPMRGHEGLLTIASPEHNGVPATSRASNYWDVIPAGYRDAYINAFLAPALQASSELERTLGDTARSDELVRLAALARREFSHTFWDEQKGRYISWIDAAGGLHDCGMTHLNLIAATHGLADPGQVRRMFRWMTEEPTASGVADTFTRWIFAPRCNTIHCAEQRNSYKYDEWCEDGGAVLWTAFYEVMARARFLGADDAWRRFGEILARFDMPDHLVGGSPMYRGEINNHGYQRGSVGVWGEFPESGLAPCAFLYAFVGVRADVGGLHVRPNLPSALRYAGVDSLLFHGRRLKITSFRERVTVEWTGGRLELPVPPDGEARITEDMLAREMK